MTLTAGGSSQRGPRDSNEDALLIDLGLGLLVVADGMGGHNAGEVASRMAVDAVAGFIRDTHANREITWPYPIDLSMSMTVNRLAVALRIANARVHAAGYRDPICTGMGTTIVAGLVDGDRIAIGHVGDSRAYAWRRGQLEQLTRDDTWLNVVEAGSADDGADHPMRHVLTNGIGMRSELVMTIAEEPLVPGEDWLFSTDGVHGVLETIVLAHSLRAPSAELAAHQVVRAALAACTSDNATAIVLHVR